MDWCTVRVPAKINLQLAVGGPREDGFHDVATLYQAVSLYDEVTASAVPAGSGSLTLTVEGEQPGSVPLDESNLALRAARALAQAAGVRPEAALLIRKAIPVAGGMAGGSADAAAALVACDALWQTACTAEQLRAIAARLGSDVPFALMGGNAVGTGRGERLIRVCGSRARPALPTARRSPPARRPALC
jgi:4-diphosphocytidyl-2-C-methyl-D-erythritol kinase